MIDPTSEMPLFRRLVIRLFPRAEAWRVAIVTRLFQLLTGFSWLPSAARVYVDHVYAQLNPSTVDAGNLADWERQFGISFPSNDEAARRLALAAKWAAAGGQSPRYLEDALQAAGFDVYLHEWWEPPNEAPRTARDPRDYANDPLIGEYQCIDDAGPQHECTDEPSGPQCTDWLMNEVNYLVNDSMTPVAPPPIPDDPGAWRYFLYVGGEVFPSSATVPLARRTEFRELMLSLFPAQQWIVTLVTYDPPATPLVTQGGDQLVTQDGDRLVA